MRFSTPSRFYSGAGLWLGCLQYYLVQIGLAAGWRGRQGYSWTANTISDLGNTRCGQYGVRSVCSPAHLVMNISFIVLGVSMAAGALLLRPYFGRNRWIGLGVSCMVLSGLGSLLVGLFPENTVSALHISGAALTFVVGNIGLVLLGAGLTGWRRMSRAATIALGVVALMAVILFRLHHYLGLGLGGMERLVAYPQTVWMIVVGLLLLTRARPSRR